jgi:glycosyltransferase involved in cell wall biosynthesis
MSEADTRPQAQGAPVRWRTNLHVYFTPMQFETRVLKITRSLVESGFATRVVVVGLWEPGLARNEVIDEHRSILRLRLLTPRVANNPAVQMLRMAEFSLRVLLVSLGKKVDLINCHMLALLPACVVQKYLLRAQLVYEPHEFESDLLGRTPRQIRVLRRIERFFARRADMVVHVGPAVAKWYSENYGIKEVHVLNNTPYAGEIGSGGRSSILHDRFQIPPTALIFIYQGQFLESRGIGLMLDVFSSIEDKSRHLVMMGFGRCQDAIERAASVQANIHFLPAVPAERIIEHTSGADVGISLRMGASPDNSLANPNKMNEYFLAGIPMIVNDHPEPARFVRERRCGWVVEADRQSLASLVARIGREEVEELRDGIMKTRGNFGWEQEEKTLVRIYGDLWTRCHGEGRPSGRLQGGA